jgi:hypothetical protein
VKGDILNLHQLDATFMRVAAIINLRPIAIWTNSNREYHSISPSDILLGRAARDRPDPTLLRKLEDDQSIKRSLANQEKRVRAWWTAWQSQAFPELVPRAAWKTSHRNVQPRDIALIKQDSKFLAPLYQLCRVEQSMADVHGQVRTCTIFLRPRRKDQHCSAKYISKKLNKIKVGVQ